MAEIIGQILGRYRVLEPLGEGGMAIVYKAMDTRLDSYVAIKVIRMERLAPEFAVKTISRFEREAKALAQLTHPNIVKVIDYGDYDGRPYLVMEYLPGGTLKQRMGRPLPWREAVGIVAPVGRALEYAHRHGFIHRDVKPLNILMTENDQPMLSDFGIAKLLDSDSGATDLTGASATIGTPEYMSPEQAVGKPVDARTDVYALGVVLYELVTGRKPFLADTPIGTLFKHVNEPLPPPGMFVPDLPGSVEALLQRALAKEPAERFPDMGAFATDLECLVQNQPLRHTGRIVLPPPLPPVPPTPKPAFPPIPEEGGTVLQSQTGLKLAQPPIPPTPIPDEGETVLQSQTRLEPVRQEIRIPWDFKAPDRGAFSLGSGIQMEFVRVPAGPFRMGDAQEDGREDEQPQHEVQLQEYWIARSPVTNEQYATFLKVNGRNMPRHWILNEIPPHEEKHPMVHVTWQEAEAFCAWLSRESGLEVRLPSEAEWEKAARGPDSRPYPWGNEPPERKFCNHASQFSGKTPVGLFSPHGDSPYGCTDMLGNVWEWTADWYDPNYYTASPVQDPHGPPMGEYRALRGGSFYTAGSILAVTKRGRAIPVEENDETGFRCVCIRTKS